MVSVSLHTKDHGETTMNSRRLVVFVSSILLAFALVYGATVISLVFIHDLYNSVHHPNKPSPIVRRR